MIGDIANTPIPTLLVVAGIIFLFLALGGSLGATIGAERLKPLPSTIVGVVLLGLGVGLYQTHGSQITPGQPPDKPANPERQEHTTPDKPANPEQQEHTTPVDLAALLEDTAWDVAPYENGVRKDPDPVPWEFHPNKTVNADNLWRGRWESERGRWESESRNRIRVWIMGREGNVADEFTVDFVSPTEFVAYKNEERYRVGRRRGAEKTR